MFISLFGVSSVIPTLVASKFLEKLAINGFVGSPAEKLEALTLAEAMVSILGEHWLIGQINLPDKEDPIPVDRFLLLVLEQSSVEVAVLLNELACLKYEASNSSSSTAQTILSKQRHVAIAFSLMEKIIKLISNASENEGSGQAKFVSQQQRRTLGLHPSRSFVEILKGQMQPRVGFPNSELTSPFRMEVGEFSSLVDPSPPTPEAHRSAMAENPTALHEVSLSLKKLDQHGELPRVVDVTADGGGHAVKSPAPVI
nr:hypothetical protein CFP56_29722 [Quercus suber]